MHKKSLLTKQLSFLLPVSIVPLFLITLFYYFHQQQVVEKMFFDEHESILKHILHNAESTIAMKEHILAEHDEYHSILIFDANKKLVFHTHDIKPEILDTVGMFKLFDQINKDSSTEMTIDKDLTLMIIPSIKNGTVSAYLVMYYGKTLDDQTHSRKQTFSYLFIIILLIALIITVAITAFTSIMLHPLRELIIGIDSISSGKWSKIENSYNDEFGYLIDTFNEMTYKLNQKNEQLLLHSQELESANKFKSEFLANMSHEIRTPMTGILGFIERLEKGEKDAQRLKQLRVIENSGQTLLAIINDILDFSKIESGKLEIELSPLSTIEIFENPLDIFTSLASTKNITLNKAIDDQLPTCIIGDSTRLKQVIFNLIGNAIKFTHEGGDVTLQVNYNDENQTLKIAVIDTGIGISKEHLQSIFEAFSQADSSTTRKFGGTGLGLSISSRLVKLMGGELKVESKVGEGSKFYFELPVEECSAETNVNLEDTAISELDSIRLKGHILIVEDNKTNQLLLGMILGDLGLTYDCANDGAEGVLKFKLNTYDLVLMDENMPIMNGIDATKRIREMEEENSSSKIPIIAVTANALTGDRERFLNAGMEDYIPKPYTEEDIIKVLQKYLTLHK